MSEYSAEKDAGSIERVLSEHWRTVAERVNAGDPSLRDYATACTCGQWSAFDKTESHDAHVAAALVAAGITARVTPPGGSDA